jgi:hypothetical protein
MGNGLISNSLLNDDKDVVVDKTVVEKINNLLNIEELNIVVDPKFDVVERKNFTNIDVLMISDSDKESKKDNSTFIGDRELVCQRVRQESCHPPSSRIWGYSRGKAMCKYYSFSRSRVFGRKVCLINGPLGWQYGLKLQAAKSGYNKQFYYLSINHIRIIGLDASKYDEKM